MSHCLYIWRTRNRPFTCKCDFIIQVRALLKCNQHRYTCISLARCSVGIALLTYLIDAKKCWYNTNTFLQFASYFAVATQGFQVFFGHFEALQILMIMSLMFAAGGFILLFLYHRREKAYDPLKTNLGILCTISWGVACKFIASLLVSCMVADSVHFFSGDN